MTLADPLTRLAIKYGTDKFGWHDYTPKYHALLAHLRDRPIRMLEIGVGGFGDPKAGGASLQTWRDYFPKAQIVRIDIAEKTLDLGPRIVVARGSQVDAAFLREIVAEHGPFDVILDDGSHQNAHVVESFGILFDTLAPNGLYIVEDVQTAFFPRFGGSCDLTAPNSVGLFADLAAALVADAAPARAISALWRYHNIIALQKVGSAPRPKTPSAATLSGDGISDAALVAALSALGDGESLSIRSLRDLPDVLRRRFVELDHRERAVFFPDVPVADLAREVCAFEARRGEVGLVKGPNDYPSNFAFDPDHPEAAAALSVWRAVLDETPSERGLQTYGRMAHQKGRGDDLHFVADRLERENAEEAASLGLILKAARDRGEGAKARQILLRAYALHPDDPVFIAQTASALMSERDLDGAERVLLEARASGHDSADICMRLGLLFIRRGDYARALEEGRAATRINRRWPQGWRVVIRAHMALEDFAAAERECLEALDICGESAPLQQCLAEIRSHRARSPSPNPQP